MYKSIKSSCFFPSFLYKVLIFAFAFISFSPIIASAAQVALEWDENDEEDLAGYRVFCREENQIYDYDHPVWEGSENSCIISRDVKSYFVVRAFNTSNMESGNSNEVFFQPYDNDQPADNPTQIINDNGDAGTSYTGTWRVSRGANPYGERSFYSTEINATYTFESELEGSYEVSLWWTYWSSRCTSVPVEIYDGETLLDTVEVNQRANAGGWNPLGTYVFSGTASVVIISEGGCTTSADAVRFLSALPNDPPENCTDADFDGYYAQSGCGTEVDCNDSDPGINPGATESCDDNVDNDCDHLIDCSDPYCDCENPFDVTLHKPADYLVVTNLQAGDEYYLDRDYYLDWIPSELDTGTEEWIKTKNRDDNNSSTAFLEFTISQPATVYVAYDSRADSPPYWLRNSFSSTSLDIEVEEGVYGSLTLNIFRRVFPAGTVTLGGNLASGAYGARSNYIVIVKPF